MKRKQAPVVRINIVDEDQSEVAKPPLDLTQIDEAKLQPIEDAAFAKGLLLQPTVANDGQLCWFVYDQYRLDNPEIAAPMFGNSLDVVMELVNEYDANKRTI